MKLIVNNLYRIETISYLFLARFTGRSDGLYQFSIVDTDVEPIGVVLAFSEAELAYAIVVQHYDAEVA